MVNEIKRDTVDYRDPTPFDNTKLNSLSDISKALRHKTYGEDTREAIAQQGEALAKLMQETGGNQSAEVVEARGGYELLGIRLNAMDAAIIKTMTADELHGLLNEKRDKSVKIKSSELDISSNPDKIQLINLSDEVQAAMAGTSPVLPTLPDNSVTKFKIADGAVVAGKIADASVIDGNIATGAVNTDNVKDEAITKFKLGDKAVVAGKIADSAVIYGNLATAAVNTENIKDKAITGFKLADGAVTSTKLGLGATKFDNIGDKQIYGRKLKHEGRPCWAYSEQLAYNEAILIVNDGATDTDPGTVAFNPKATTIAFFFEDRKVMTTPDKVTINTSVLDFNSKQAIYVYFNPDNSTLYLGKVHNPDDLEKLMADCVYLGMAFPPYMADKSNNRIGIDWNGVFTEDIKRRPFGGMGKFIGDSDITVDWTAKQFVVPIGLKNVFCHPIGLSHAVKADGSDELSELKLNFDGTVYLQTLLYNTRTRQFKVLRMDYTHDFRHSDCVAVAYADLNYSKLVLL